MTSDAGVFFSSLCKTALERGAFVKLVFSKPVKADTPHAAAEKITGVPVDSDGRASVHFTKSLTDGKVLHVNIAQDNIGTYTDAALEAFAQGTLITQAGLCEYRRNRHGDTVVGGDKLSRLLKADGFEKAAAQPHDRKKAYILDASEPFMQALGITDKSGSVAVGMRGKFRQINRFLEYLRDIEPKLPPEIEVADLCCGKSYLSFAVFLYLTRAGHKVNMTGVDLKADVIDYCNSMADKLAIAADGSSLRFISADINSYQPRHSPDLVISLHACDTATDIVLSFAVRHGARFIMSTPCCQHELNHKIDCVPLRFVTDYSMLRQKLCEAATDALRCAYLKMNGYAVEAVELVDPEDTPKNVLLRAELCCNFGRDLAQAEKLREEYSQARAFLGLD